MRKCGRCGSKHPAMACKAYGKKCMKCQRLHHSAWCCKTKNVYVLDDAQQQQGQEFYCGVLTVDKQSNTSNISTSWNTDLKVNDIVVNFKLDTGAEVNVINTALYNKLSTRES